MFSIVIYDIKKKKIIIARDRLGIKPLYFRKIKNNYYFSSEIKPLLKLANYSQDLILYITILNIHFMKTKTTLSLEKSSKFYLDIITLLKITKSYQSRIIGN